jgi:hypothetical protein
MFSRKLADMYLFVPHFYYFLSLLLSLFKLLIAPYICCCCYCCCYSWLWCLATKSRMAIKLLHKSRMIRPSTNLTGRYARGLTCTAYVNYIARWPSSAHPGNGCILHTPWYTRNSPSSFSIYLLLVMMKRQMVSGIGTVAVECVCIDMKDDRKSRRQWQYIDALVYKKATNNYMDSALTVSNSSSSFGSGIFPGKEGGNGPPLDLHCYLCSFCCLWRCWLLLDLLGIVVETVMVDGNSDHCWISMGRHIMITLYRYIPYGGQKDGQSQSLVIVECWSN